jgi:hypothetical protein
MMIEVMDIDKQERINMFFLPSDVSAKVAKANVPMRQPMKNEDCGKHVMKLLALSRFH